MYISVFFHQKQLQIFQCRISTPFFLEKLDERAIFTKEDKMSTCQGFRKLANGFTEFGCMFWKGCLEKKIINNKKRKHFDPIFELWQVVMGRMTFNKTAVLRKNYLKTLRKEYLKTLRKNYPKTLRKNDLKTLRKSTLKHAAQKFLSWRKSILWVKGRLEFYRKFIRLGALTRRQDCFNFHMLGEIVMLARCKNQMFGEDSQRTSFQS